MKDMGSEMFSRYRVSLSCLSSGVRSATFASGARTKSRSTIFSYRPREETKGTCEEEDPSAGTCFYHQSWFVIEIDYHSQL